LATLSIIETVVYNAHKNKDLLNGYHLTSKSGKHMKKIISNDEKDFVREHIMSFPKIESHYRREQTSKFYFESQLNIAKIYELYEEKW
jgi:hypothetical protein